MRVKFVTGSISDHFSSLDEFCPFQLSTVGIAKATEFCAAWFDDELTGDRIRGQWFASTPNSRALLDELRDFKPQEMWRFN